MDRAGLPIGVVIRLGNRHHIGEQVVRLAFLGDLLVAALLDLIQVGAAGNEPVERLAGDVVVLADDGVIGVVAALLHMHVHDRLLVHEAVAAAPCALRFAAEDGHVGRGAVDVRGALQAHHLGARLGSGASGGNAGAAQADNHDVGVDGFLHGGIVDGGSLAQPRHSAGAVEAHRGHAGCSGVILFGRARRGGRRARAQARHAGQRSAGDSGAGQEIAAGETLGFFGHDESSLFL